MMFSCQRQQPSSATFWPETTKESRPWTRWWWMGSAVDQENLSRLLEQYADAGFGGVEITPIYGVQGNGEQNIDFLSPQWMEMLTVTTEKAAALDMGVDMNQGTGWPFGGPQITREHAAGRLIIQQYGLQAGEKLDEKLILSSREENGPEILPEAVTAYGPDGKVQHVLEHLDEEGTLQWTPAEGTWEVYAAFCGKTGQMVKRAAPGGEGYSMDHFSEEAVETYLGRFDEVFQKSADIRCFFNDSYEVYHASWTPGLFEIFKKRRGYDLRDHVRELTGEGDEEVVTRIKCDYRLTLSELLLENFTMRWTDWAHDHSAMTRNQAHGSPGNLIDLYAAVDIPECEIYGHTEFEISGLRHYTNDRVNVEPDPLMMKLATSAANLAGKNLISNETFTWLGEHFRVSLAQCKPEAEEAFLSGINHLFYHGTTYSPRDARWPGWLFYASVNFAPSNSFWPHLEGLNRYVTRCQTVLQEGKPEHEALVYWPVFDIWSNPEGLEIQLTVHNIREWLNYPSIKRMSDQGHSFDFISDRWLLEARVKDGKIRTSSESLPYQALIIPRCQYIPPETLKKVLQLSRDGAVVIMEQVPGDVPGWSDLETRKEEMQALLEELSFEENEDGIMEYRTGKGVVLISEDFHRALHSVGIPSEKINQFGLKYCRRELDDGRYYYLVNHSPDDLDAMLPLNTDARSIVIMDPQNGESGLGDADFSQKMPRVRVQLASGESLILRTFRGDAPAIDPWEYYTRSGPELTISGPWTLEAIEGGPQIPETIRMDRLVPWTGLGDSAWINFSGTAIYKTAFEVEGLSADEYLLDLGTVYESAGVWLNGRKLGIAYSNPFALKAGHLLREGRNELTIEVANLMANRIRYLDRNEVEWKKFHDINIVNIRYEPFDASGWETMRSGLEGPLTLIPLELDENR
ncbi:MAG: glycosyl hydrolase [Bacteroidales bacterium]